MSDGRSQDSGGRSTSSGSDAKGEDGSDEVLRNIRKLQLPPRPSASGEAVTLEEGTTEAPVRIGTPRSGNTTVSSIAVPGDVPSMPSLPQDPTPPHMLQAIPVVSGTHRPSTSSNLSSSTAPSSSTSKQASVNGDHNGSSETQIQRMEAPVVTVPSDTDATGAAGQARELVADDGGTNLALSSSPSSVTAREGSSAALPLPLPPLPPPPQPSTTQPATFTSSLQELQQRLHHQMDVDVFIDPHDKRNMVTTLQTPEEVRHLEQLMAQQQSSRAAAAAHPSNPQSGTSGAHSSHQVQPPSTPQTATLKRAKNVWEKTKNVSLFADSSSEDNGLVYSDADGSVGSSAVSETGGGRRVQHRHDDPPAYLGGKRGEKETSRSRHGAPLPCKDELDEVSPEEAAAQREAERKARERRQRKLAKAAARRMIFKNAETTVTSTSSTSQQGVSPSSASGGVSPPEQTRGRKESRSRADRRLRFSGVDESGVQANSNGEANDEEVDVDANAPHVSAPPTGASSTALVPYVPTLKGPVSILKAIYTPERTTPPGKRGVSTSSSLFTWRPSWATLAAASALVETTPSPGVSYAGALHPDDNRITASTDALIPREAFHNTLSVTIRGMSPLHADVGVVHPFVRVWLVHCVTGQNLVDSGAALPCAITHPYDIRSHGSRSPWWEAEIAVRLDQTLMRVHHKTGVLLFEVLDCGSENIYGYYMPRNGLYPICWGFLMLHDCFGLPGVLFAENVHVQLFRYPLRTPWYVQWFQTLLPQWCASEAVDAPTEFFMDKTGVLQGGGSGPEDLAATTSATDRTGLLASMSTLGAARSHSPPAVFMFFKSPLYRSLPYDGGLVVTVKVPEAAFYVPKPAQMLPYEEYLMNLLVAGGGSCAVPRRLTTSSDESAGGPDGTMIDPLIGGRAGRLRAMLRSMSIVNQHALGQEYARREGERVLLPHTTLQTTPVAGAVTCMAFLRNSPILAMGVTRNLQYVVELRNTVQPDLPVLAQLFGHTAHIHSVAVQREDRFVLACSADKTVRVWRVTDLSQTILATLQGPFATPNAAQLVVEPVCVLPHAFPVYSAMFHQDTIITAGYHPQLQVWRYDKQLSSPEARHGQLGGGRGFPSPPRPSPSQASLSRDMASSMQLTATFTPGLNATDPNMSGRLRDLSASAMPQQQLGELIFTTDAEDDGIVLSIASNEHSGRVWSVTSGGSVRCWRALYEVVRKDRSPTRAGHGPSGGRRGSEALEDLVWQMSVRQRSDCAGASRVEVAGLYAVVTCRQSPVVYVFDATTCESIRVVNTRLSPNTPIRLLPDGEAFVAGTCEGGLAAWECADGGLCTPSQGDYTRAKTKFPIMDLVWAHGQQLVALQSPAPCPENFLPTYGVVPALSSMQMGTGPGVTAPPAMRPEVPTEVTLIAVAGTSRHSGTPIVASDRMASEDFCLQCGGDLANKRRAVQSAARARALRRQQAEHESRKMRLYKDVADPRAPVPAHKALFSEPSTFFGNTASAPTASAPTTVTTSDLDTTNIGLKINSILGFWRGLVGQHRHLSGDQSRVGYPSGRDDGGSEKEEASTTLNLAQRANRYAAGAAHSDEEDSLRE